jgi:hypothetical protein
MFHPSKASPGDCERTKRKKESLEENNCSCNAQVEDQMDEAQRGNKTRSSDKISKALFMGSQAFSDPDE